MNLDSELKERISTKETPLDKKCRILSYNIFMRPPGISSDKLGDLKNERIQVIQDYILPQYDIICFQEMFSLLSSRRKNLIKAAREMGYLYSSLPPEQPCCSLFFVNSGLLTLSRHRIVTTDFVPFKNCSGSDSFAFKGIMYSRIMIDDSTPLNLFNVHLQAHYHGRDHKNIRSRLNQISEMKAAMDGMMAKHTNIRSAEFFEEAVYLIGDMNVCANKHLFPKQGYLKRSKTNDNFFEFIDSKETEIMDPHFSEYDYLVYMLKRPFVPGENANKVVDCLYERYGFHPITYIDSIHNERDPDVLPNVRDQDSLDYIFQIIPGNQTLDKVELKENVKETRIQPFQVKDKPFRYVSDHLGVEFTLAQKNVKNGGKLVTGETR